MKPQAGVGENRKKMLKTALYIQGGFLVTKGITMNKLFECAINFEKLLDKRYHMIIGRKGKSVEIKLTFKAFQFHHLVGLHKLHELRLSRDNREKIFDDILSGDISLEHIIKKHSF
jgi:hypothetical protein